MIEKIEKIKFNGVDTGLMEIFPKIFKDERGYFLETFLQTDWTIQLDENESRVVHHFIQENESCSSKNVIRGLHYQYFAEGKMFSQSKLVRVIKGSVIDFVLDLRKSSDSFGELFWFKLDDKRKNQLFIPKGFAHGFVSLEDDTIFSYKCDMLYNKNSECGINVFDPELKINEKILIPNNLNINELIISEKDKNYPKFKNQKLLFF